MVICLFIFYIYLFLQSLLHGLSIRSFPTSTCFFSRYYMVCLSVHFLHLPVSSVATTWSVYLFISYIYLFLQSLLHGLSICSFPTSTCFFSCYYMVHLSIFYFCRDTLVGQKNACFIITGYTGQSFDFFEGKCVQC